MPLQIFGRVRMIEERGKSVKDSAIKIGLVLLTMTTFLSGPLAAADPPIALSPIVNGLVLPIHITHAGDGSGRLFLVEQAGQVRIFQNGALAALPFLNIGDRVSCCGEQGLLSIAFPPQYAQKGYFYASYTDINGNSVISRFFLTADPNVANPASEVILLTVTQPFANHNGGLIAFGPDGYLYIGFGDGGSGGDPNNFAQNLNDLPGNQKFLGKILRVDVESGAIPYTIPPTNPILNGVRSEIWALGLRNPWRFSFDRQTGDLYLADVGQASFEEVNFQPAASTGGQNYGWRLMEGNHCFNPPVDCNPGTPVLTLPIQEYDHSQGDCSVTGGFVYRGTQFALMQGIYFYGDFCSGRIRGLRNVNGIWQNQLFMDSALNITTFGEDESGEIFVADYASGTLYKIIAERFGIFWRNISTGRTSIWYRDGATLQGTFTDVQPTLSDPNWNMVGVADFNADANPDVLWRNGATGRTTIWYMDGPTWNGGSADVEPTLADPNWSIVGIADFNRDGNPDLLWRDASTGRMTVWYMTGPIWNGGYADVEPTLADPNWSLAGIADFNRDGSLDLLWRDSSSGRTTIWYMTGTTWNGAYADVLPTLSDPDWQIAAVRDFNQDGNPDLLWRNTSRNPGNPNAFRTTVWYLNGPVWNGNWGDLLPVLADPNWIIVGR